MRRKATEKRQKKSQHPSWLSNTGSNVSNVVPVNRRPGGCLSSGENNDNGYQYRL